MERRKRQVRNSEKKNDRTVKERDKESEKSKVKRRVRKIKGGIWSEWGGVYWIF